MTRTIKFICAVGCFISALFPGGLALLLFTKLGGSEILLGLCIASVLSALAFSLVWSGSHLITRLGLPISRKAKTLILLDVFCLIGLITIAANFIKARATTAANPCINNLRQMDAAAQQWALETGQNSNAIATTAAIKLYIKLNSDGNIPPCPAGGTYSAAWSIKTNPTCSLGTTVSPAHALRPRRLPLRTESASQREAPP